MLQVSSRRRRIVLTLMVAASLAVGTQLAFAESDHELARKAVAAGEILPLRKIVARVEQDFPGQILEVELERERESGVWFYEIKLLRKGGALIKLKVDARDGSVLGMEGKRDKRR